MENSTHHTTSYVLDTSSETKNSFVAFLQGSKEFIVFMKGDGWKIFFTFLLVLLKSIADIATPYFVAISLDRYISKGDIAGLGNILLVLIALYLVTTVIGYYQAKLMGGVAQQTLFRLRSKLFEKLQDLPIAFFNQNKAGDLMSRLNSDTDKLNQFLSESITRFVGMGFVIIGIGIFVFFIQWKLALVMLAMVLVLIILTQIISPWVERQNKNKLKTVGLFSSSLQENLTNFRVIVAYNKRKYFQSHLEEATRKTFSTALRADIANRVFEPIYEFAGALSLIGVLAYGFHLISIGQLTIGLLVAFVSYTQKFYDPLRILATIFGAIQLSLAAWSRIRAVLNLETNLVIHQDLAGETSVQKVRMEIRDMAFGYKKGQTVIEGVNLSFEAGKTYALVGPTGGGKSTLASLMSRLYDPVSGKILLEGRDIRSYSLSDRAILVSVILQDPILFTGNVADNIRYGNEDLYEKSDEELESILRSKGFEEVITRFNQGLKTEVFQNAGAGLSLGQRQLISFMRVILREPKVLILDEATANIDTVTEMILTKTLEALPKDTTKIIIAHRLNTIKDADEIMFVNGHHVTRAGSFHDAIGLIEKSKRTS